jgi:hypothetical protein
MSKESLIAYFDILGYQSFLNSNSAVDAAEKVFKLVKQAPKEAVTTWEESELVKGDEEWKKVITTVKSLVFSDTIVVSCPIEESDPTNVQAALMAGISLAIAKKCLTADYQFAAQ